MTPVPADFRDLYDRLSAYDGRDVIGGVLDPWVTDAAAELAELAAFAARPLTPGPTFPEATFDDLWRLYAASRVSQRMLLRFQPWRPGQTQYAGPNLSVAEYAEFWGRLGFAAGEPDAFHPFFCEVVGVEQADDPAAPPELADVLWPCVTLGPLVFERAGCVVYAGRDHVDKEKAEVSTLYWAHRRRHRPCEDQSLGWGSNSQWRTAFRRDYVAGRGLHYNIDGKTDPTRPAADARPDWPPGGLTAAERVELLTHRCFVRTAEPHDDLYPYDETYSGEGG